MAEFRHFTYKTPTMSTEISRLMGGSVICVTSNVQIDVHKLDPSQSQRKDIENGLRRAIKSELRANPDVYRQEPIVIVDGGWDSVNALVYKAEKKLLTIELTFKLSREQKRWTDAVGVVQEIMKGVEATVIEVLSANNQVIIQQKCN